MYIYYYTCKYLYNFLNCKHKKLKIVILTELIINVGVVQPGDYCSNCPKVYLTFKL